LKTITVKTMKTITITRLSDRHVVSDNLRNNYGFGVARPSVAKLLFEIT